MQVFSNLHTLFYKLGGEQISYTYDYLNRLTRKTVGTTPYTYTYYAPYENLESALPHSILYQPTAGPVKEFQYTYDNLGNIKTTWERTGNSPLAKTGEYWYDRFNQPTREETAGQTRFYEYDTYGNLLWVERYNYIGFEDLQDARNAVAYIPSYNLGTDVYTYGDSEWKDLLTAYNGHAITYDAIGNPLTYYNGADYTMTWRQGRRLSNVTTGGQTINYEYDSEGKRTGKQVGTAQTTYLYAGGRLVSIEGHTPDYRIDLLYDESGVYGCIYNDASHTQTKHRFVKNAQGDIIQIRDQSDAVVANYTYDAWGALLSVTDENGAAITASAHIALRNPIRYRGYLYDSETGFYWVQARYYDPAIRRWINADSYISTGNGVLEKNMFAYCLNNPVNMVDPSGEIAITTLILIGSIVAGVAVSGYTAYTSHKYTGKVDWNNTILSGLSTFAFCYTYGMSAYGMYVSYCDYKGYTPVTNIGSAPKTNPAPYSNLQDPSNVAPGKDFTASQKAQIIQQNKINNNGVVKSDLSGQTLVPPQKSMKGVTPPANEWQIDHIIPKSAGGTNSFSNAQVLSREENRIKWDH